jgi:hypothetical protein
MKTLKTIVLTLVAMALLAPLGAYAQNRAEANIPFDFTVQGVTLPAGHYDLQRVSIGSDVIQIQNLDTGKEIMAFCPGAMSSYRGKDKGELVFHRYGEEYFFSEIWSPIGPQGGVRPSKLEKELKSSQTEKELALVMIPLSGDAR